MAERIGFNSGITAFMKWLRAQPNVQKPGPNYDRANINTWPWPDKLERTLTMLRDMHDAVATSPNPPTKPPPVTTPPAVTMMAPQTINPEGSSDAKYCVKHLPWDPARNRHYEPSDPGITYNTDGLCDGGRTNDRVIPGLRGSRTQDGADICGYAYDGKTYPPWPAASYLK